MERSTIGFNGSAKELYEAEGAPDLANHLGRYAMEVEEVRPDESHPEHYDQETANAVTEARKNRAMTALKIAAGVGAAAVTVAYLVHKGRHLPPFNHD